MRALSLLAGAAGLLGTLRSAPAEGAERLQHFITRQGVKLMDGDQEFRFVGANMPGLVLPYDWTLSLPERLHLPGAWEQEDGFKTLDQMNLRVVRTWNLPMGGAKEEAKPWHYLTGPGQFNEEAFKVVGGTNDWLTYHTPVAIESVKLTAFFDKGTADLAAQVSADGAAFAELTLRRTERRLQSPHRGAAGGQTRTMVEYEAAAPAGSRVLKVRWNGPAELDRVEIWLRD